jgi:hypothetical protein
MQGSRLNCHGEHGACDHGGRTPPADDNREMNSNEENSSCKTQPINTPAKSTPRQIDPT